MLELIAEGFAAALTPQNVLFALIGVVLGTVIGILPGLGSATGVALLLPLTAGLSPLTALIMLAGIYYGSQFGATVTAVLIGTPGEASSMMTALDGYPLARQGRGGPALAMGAIASFGSGVLTIPLLMLTAPSLSTVAMRFGPPETFALMLFALLSVSALGGRNTLKGLAMALVGVFLATIGIEHQTGQTRFTAGQIELLDGVGMVPVIIGVFAIAEVLRQVSLGGAEPIKTKFKDMLPTLDDWRVSRGPIARQGLLGFLIGVLPGAGAAVATFFGYSFERRKSKHSEEFGSGRMEGVVAAEAANNGAVNGSFVPTLTLGVPGSATTAILLAGFLIHGIRPGPLLMEQEPTLVWGLMASFFLGNVALLILNFPLAPAFASLLRLPYSYMYPVILLLSLSGAYAIRNSLFDVWVALIAGLAGYWMNRFEYPAAPLILGIILGDGVERTLGQTSAMGSGDLTILIQRPVSLTLLLAGLGTVVASQVWRYVKRPTKPTA